MSATFTYGSYTSDDGEVTLSRFDVLAIESPRRERIMLRRQMNVTGIIIRDTQADLLTRIEEFITAFDEDKQGDATLKLNGSDTPHFLSNGSLTGVRVTARSWPRGDPHELVKSRTYSVTLTTLEDAADGTAAQIERYQETIQVFGNAGPDFRVIRMPLGLSRVQQLSQTSPVRVVQSGQSVGYAGYVLPFGKTVAALNHGPSDMLSSGSPSKEGNAFRHYPMQWRYVYFNSTPTAAAPLPK